MELITEGSGTPQSPLFSKVGEQNLIRGRIIRNERGAEGRLDFNDIPFIMPANDNSRTKDCLSARCGSLLRRLTALHSLRGH
jgi:hypothetical protein